MEESVADNTDLVNVPFESRVSQLPEIIAREYGYVPRGSDLLCITSCAERPPLLPNEFMTSVTTHVYDMTHEFAGKVEAFLHLKSTTESGFDLEVPLAMVPYKKPLDLIKLYDLSTCKKLDEANEAVTQHNRYIVSLLSMFIRQNGCSTSANSVTLPSPPENYTVTRGCRIKKIMDDKYSTTILAVRYLKEHDKIAETDYFIENAVDAANTFAFEKAIEEKMDVSKESGKPIKFRVPGSRPACWSGCVEDNDNLGRRVHWARDETHTFISPGIHVELVPLALETVDL